MALWPKKGWRKHFPEINSVTLPHVVCDCKAHVVCSPSIYKWMEIFIQKFRKQLGEVDTTNTAPVFLTTSQRKMHSSHIGAQIDSCWGKVFVKAASSGGATAFRKAVVSAVQEFQEEIRDDAATLMVHNKATADRY